MAGHSLQPEVPSPGDNLPSEHEGATLLAPDWTEEEEAKAKRKVDLTIMPLLMLGFFCLQLDRGNIANAITDNFRKDIGIVQNQFNVGQQLLSVGIVVLEIPANILLYRFGPSRWLSMQIVAFGLVSLFQAFQSNYAGFLVTRLLLGLAESGFIPGGLYTLTTWYTRAETAKRVMIFFVGNLAASATTNLLAYGILHMRGVAGRAGWFWLFVLMGLFSVLSGLVIALLLPDSVARPRSFFLPKLQLFTARELHILRHRVILDDPSKGQKHVRITGRAVLATLSNWRIYPHVMITLLNNAPLTAFGTYAPTIINSFGYPKLRSNALASVGPWITIPISVAFSLVSDKFHQRATTTIGALVLNTAFMICNLKFTDYKSKSTRLAGVIMTQSIYFTAHPLNIAWMTVHLRNSEQRAVAMAMMIMAANAAGIYGAQLFRADDSPKYHRGLTINVAILAGALGFAIFQAVQYRLTARKKGEAVEDVPSQEQSHEKDVESNA